MPTLVVYADTSDNYIQSDDNTYLTARAGTGSVGIGSVSGTTVTFGQALSGSLYLCREVFLSFDTSALAGMEISAALLALFHPTGSDLSATDFVMEARAKDWGAAVDTGDWVAGASLGSLPLLASLTTAGLVTNTYTTLDDVAFPANVVRDGVTRIMLNSDRHRLGDVPTGDEIVQPRSADVAGTTNDPKLTITYSVPFIQQSGSRMHWLAF